MHPIDKVEVERDCFLVPYPEDPPGVLTWYRQSDDYGQCGLALAVSRVPLVSGTLGAKRKIFNLTPVDNSLEKRFAAFLDRATDVAAFAKLTLNASFAPACVGELIAV